MNSYEYLQEEAREDGVNVIDYPFDSNRIRGLYCDGTVAIRQDMTTVEKSCVLAEELGHHRMTVGNILDQNDVVIANRNILQGCEPTTVGSDSPGSSWDTGTIAITCVN